MHIIRRIWFPVLLIMVIVVAYLYAADVSAMALLPWLFRPRPTEEQPEEQERAIGWLCAACGTDEYGPSYIVPSVCYQCQNARLAGRQNRFAE